MRRPALLLSAAVISCPAQAAPLSLEGTYRFVATERGTDGEPVCTEKWVFSAPDSLEVTSGQEVALNRFHTESDSDGDWLVTRKVSTNGRADCRGRVDRAMSRRELRLSIMRFHDGTMLVCPPPAHTDDGMPGHGECVASLNKLN